MSSPRLQILAPLAGEALPLSDVPDPVFSQAMMGPGMAVDAAGAPGEETTALAPVSGEVLKAHAHAVIILHRDEQGEETGVLVHLGINTVRLNGAGFTVLVTEGQQVEAGDPIVRWRPGDLPALAAQAGLDPDTLSAVSPVIALEKPAETLSDLAAGTVEAGSPLFSL